MPRYPTHFTRLDLLYQMVKSEVDMDEYLKSYLFLKIEVIMYRGM